MLFNLDVEIWFFITKYDMNKDKNNLPNNRTYGKKCKVVFFCTNSGMN